MFVQTVSESEDQPGTDCMRRLVNSFRARLEVNSFTPDALVIRCESLVIVAPGGLF